MSLSLGQKAGWGLADMGIVVFVIVKQLLILAFMNSFLGIPIALAGAVTTAVLIFDIITDPIIGYFSDKTVSRFGRRAPWMLVGAVVLALAMIGLFAVPENFTTNASLIWVTVFFLIPATTAFMAWIFLNEQLTKIDLIGFLIASLGVFIATRNK